MAVFTDTQLASIVSEIEKQNNTLYKFVAKYATNSWAKLQAIVKTGRAREFFEIGDEFVCNYKYNGTDYDWTWVCADFRNAKLENGAIVPSMVLQSKYSTIESIVFDSREQVEATETTAQEGIYYYGLTGTTVSAANLTLLNLSTGDDIPYASYNKIFKSSVYDTTKNAIASGYNRYLYSAIRKWLNSSAAIGEDWFGELDHVGQVKPENAMTLAGFMYGLDEDFLAIINPVEIQVATNTVTDGGATDTMYDRFFLPSIEEMYGAPQAAGIEGTYFPYWKDRSELNEPTNNVNDGRKILPVNASSAQTCRLRSCHRVSSTDAWYCNSNGSLSNNKAYINYQLAPCCVIC